MNKNKLICSDFDGTICINGKVSNETLRAIRVFTNEGGLFTLATGRSFRGIPKDIVALCNMPIICSNGSVIYDNLKQKIIYENCIEPTKLYEHIKSVRKHWNIIHVVCRQMSYDFCPSEIEKILSCKNIHRVSLKFTKNTEKKSLMTALRNISALYISQSDEKFTIDLTSGDKGTALKWLREHYLNNEIIISLGNNYSDLPLKANSDSFYVVKGARNTIKRFGIKLNSSINPIDEILAREEGYYGSLHPLLYLKTVHNHRKEVFKLCSAVGLRWRGLIHDLSKYGSIEFFNGIKYYCGTKSPITLERKLKGHSNAWDHHVFWNKHHSEHWIKKTEKREEYLPMPTKFWIESVCDKVAACKIYMGKTYTKSAPLERFRFEHASERMEESTAKLVYTALNILSTEGEDAFLTYLSNCKNNCE